MSEPTMVPCLMCNGTGKVGIYADKRNCRECYGSGQVTAGTQVGQQVFLEKITAKLAPTISRTASGDATVINTITELVNLVTEINTANGWRESKGEVLSEETPEAQIAGLSFVSGGVADVVEAVRKPDDLSVSETFDGLQKATDLANHMGITDHTQYYLAYITREQGKPLYGSKTQAICRARLMDTETEELTKAILNGDVPNMAEELADIVIRVMDFAGAWNEAHPDQPIDLEAAILAKLERNRTRGYRHGGKLA